MSNDQWQHRGSGMKCGTCMWFVEKPRPVPTETLNKADYERFDSRGALGRCRRHCPTMSGYPAVFQADWCGDHKLDETK